MRSSAATSPGWEGPGGLGGLGLGQGQGLRVPKDRGYFWHTVGPAALGQGMILLKKELGEHCAYIRRNMEADAWLHPPALHRARHSAANFYVETMSK